MKKELLKGLSEEQIQKVKDCDNIKDLMQLAIDEGVELNDEQLAAISGGACSDSDDEKKKHRKYDS